MSDPLPPVVDAPDLLRPLPAFPCRETTAITDRSTQTGQYNAPVPEITGGSGSPSPEAPSDPQPHRGRPAQ